MCIMLYLAADKELPFWEWGRFFRAIRVWGPHDNVPALQEIFSKPYVYSVNTNQTGDGCGFQGESALAQQAREELATFLDQALADASEVELFVRYFDEMTQEIAPVSFDRIGPSDIRIWRRAFQPDEFLVINKETYGD